MHNSNTGFEASNYGLVSNCSFYNCQERNVLLELIHGNQYIYIYTAAIQSMKLIQNLFGSCFQGFMPPSCATEPDYQVQ